ncbi:MAG: GYD domain-containing protein [Nitrospiraceae bacterium]|nr:GYD domain-containing protein [Nitrospiraceae bacterium]
MPRYIILMNLTEQGAKTIKEAPARIQDAARALEAAGGKMVDFYTVLGQYDYVCIADVPSDEVGLMQLLGMGAVGNVKTVTLRAFTKDEFAAAVKKLP